MISARKIWCPSLALKASFPRSCIRNVPSTRTTSRNSANDLKFLQRCFSRLQRFPTLEVEESLGDNQVESSLGNLGHPPSSPNRRSGQPYRSNVSQVNAAQLVTCRR